MYRGILVGRSLLFVALVAAVFVLLGVLGRDEANGSDVTCGFFIGGMIHAHPWVTDFANQRCVERDRLETAGHQFIFVDVVGHRSAISDRRRNLAREAVQRAALLYKNWFTITDALIVSGHDPRVEEIGAYAYTSGDRLGCLIWLDNTAAHAGRTMGDSDADQLQRTIAHELLHCVLFADRRVDNRYLRWRDEGAAEYFAGLAIPSAGANVDQITGFSGIESQPLYELGFDSFPFFAYLGRKRGPEAVVDLLRRASRDHSAAGSVATLQSVASIGDLFHAMAQDYSKGRLTDENGRPLDLAPTLVLPNMDIDHEGNYPVAGRPDQRIKPFTISIGEYTFKRSVTWRVRDGSTTDGVTSSWVERESYDWRRLPTDVDVSTCSDDKRGYILSTSSPASPVELPLFFDARFVPGRQIACRCPEGSWHMGTEALRARWQHFLPGVLESGGITIQFVSPGEDGYGRAVAIYNDVTTVAAIDRDSSMRTVMSGELRWKYRRVPWSLREAGMSAPAGPGIEALGLERTLESSTVTNRVDFIANGRVVNSRRTPTRANQASGARHLVGAYCVGGRELNLVATRSDARGPPGDTSLPPYTGVFRR